MKGYTTPPEEAPQDDLDDNLPMWESLVVNAVGAVIEFWGFKRNQGRVWGLLYLRSHPMDAAALRDALGLSKGAASMLLRELEGWGVIHRSRPPDSASWRFSAQVDLLQMIGHVFREREVVVVQRVLQDLAEAERLARLSEGVAPEALERLRRMRRLAGIIEHALGVFLRTARLDVAPIHDILRPDHEDMSEA